MTRPSQPAAASTFKSWLDRYATAATIASFGVVSLSGVLIFFHLGEGVLMGLHEWLGIAFVVAASLHVVRHLPSFKNHLARPRARRMLALTAFVSAVFIGGAAINPGGGNPMKQFVRASADAPLSALARVVGISPEALAGRFAAAGIPDVTGTLTLNEIAARTDFEPRRLFAIVVDGR